jgi:hypothetical protein
MKTTRDNHTDNTHQKEANKESIKDSKTDMRRSTVRVRIWTSKNGFYRWKGFLARPSSFFRKKLVLGIMKPPKLVSPVGIDARKSFPANPPHHHEHSFAYKMTLVA